MSAAVEQLARAACDAWFTLAELPTRWASATPPQRATFHAMARAAIAAGREARNLSPAARELAVAEGMAGAFLAGPDCPAWLRQRYAWPTLARQERELFRQVAAAVIAAGRSARLAQAAAA
jgi:hypothetical protein